MKNAVIVAVMLLANLFTYCYAQDVRVSINNQNATNNGGGFTINGIPSSEDIGGVDVQGVAKCDGRNGTYYKNAHAVFTNYNDFTVTVLFKDATYDRVYTIVLRKDETKDVNLYTLSTIPRSEPEPDEPCSIDVGGMIVRKLGQ